jgi:hypothetical protein
MMIASKSPLSSPLSSDEEALTSAGSSATSKDSKGLFGSKVISAVPTFNLKKVEFYDLLGEGKCEIIL